MIGFHDITNAIFIQYVYSNWYILRNYLKVRLRKHEGPSTNLHKFSFPIGTSVFASATVMGIISVMKQALKHILCCALLCIAFTTSLFAATSRYIPLSYEFSGIADKNIQNN